MKRTTLLLASLIIVLALGLALLPKKNKLAETNPEFLLSSIVEKSRYLSVDQVTHRIIENDPTLLLIDLRPADQFSTFTLPGALNLLSDSLLTQTNFELFSQPGKDKVLFANADQTAEKAWLLCTRYSLNRIYIMKGGMNEWYNTIINQKEISATPSSTDLELNQFRKAARQFFIGSAESGNAPVSPAVKKQAPLVRKAPRANSGGGC